MKKTLLAAIMIAVLAIVGAGAYIISSDGGDKTDHGWDTPSYAPDTAGQKFTDGADREVTVPDEISSIVTIGTSGPLRFISMFDMFDHVVECDEGDVTTKFNGRAFSYAYPYSTIESTHATKSIDPSLVEKLGKSKPTYVVTYKSIYDGNVLLFSTLSKNTTLIVMNDQEQKFMTDSEGALADYFVENIDMLGTAFGKEARAEEMKSGILNVIDDIESLKGSSDKSVYIAGVTWRGSNSLDTTFPTYLPFTLNGIKNAYDLGSEDKRVILDIEEFSKLDIDAIVIDPTSSDKIPEKQSQLVLEYIYGLNNDSDDSNDIPLYITAPIVWCHINYDCVLVSAYYTESVIYNTLTVEEAREKAVDVFELFYGEHGTDVLDKMSDFFVWKSSENGQEMPLMGEVIIEKNGDIYSLKSAV